MTDLEHDFPDPQETEQKHQGVQASGPVKAAGRGLVNSETTTPTTNDLDFISVTVRVSLEFDCG